MTSSTESIPDAKAARAVRLAIIVAALGYFVDIYDLVLFSIVRVKSLQGIGITDPAALLDQGVLLINMQMGGMLIPILIMFAIIYFLMIRPQQKQQKKHTAMISALKKGDKVITNAGIFGTVTGMTEAVLTLEVAKNVHIRVLRGQVAGMQPDSLGAKESEAQPVVPDEKK